MRFIAAALVIAASVAVSVSFAQEQQPQLDFDDRPTARSFSRNYPHRAGQDGVSGAGVLCCTINDERRLDCSVPIEWPAEYGFGQATLRVSREFLVSEASYARWRDDPQPITRVIIWRLGSGSPELEAVFDRIRAGSRDACRPSTLAPEPAAEPAPQN